MMYLVLVHVTFQLLDWPYRLSTQEPIDRLYDYYARVVPTQVNFAPSLEGSGLNRVRM